MRSSDERRVTRRTLARLLVLVGVVLAVAAMASASTAVANAARNRGLVVSPRPGETIRSYPITVRVRASDSVGALRVWLNDRSIGSQFGLGRDGVRSLQVSISQGLMRGSNLLLVWTSRSGGGWSKEVVRFTLADNRPFAGAGPDALAVVGQRVRLFGTSVPGAGATGSAFDLSGVGLRWALIDRPRNSRRLVLSNQGAASISFTPAVPGPYTFRLTATGAGGASSDTVTVDVVPATPLVPVETQASQGGTPGIKVGGTFYAEDVSAGGFSGYPYWQVLVLDRKTLGLVSNTTYDCLPPTGCGYKNTQADALATDVAKLDNTKLVIAAWHAINRPVFETDLNEFKTIGAPRLNGAAIRNGYASLIGVPGLPEGHAFSRLVPLSQENTAGGDMVGYLTPDQYFMYTFLPKDRVQFDTRATPTGGFDNAMQVGGTLYQTKLGGVPGGYHVVVLDGFTLKQRDGGFFQTGQTDVAGATAAAKQMTDFLKQKVGPDDVVLIDSIDLPGEAPLNGGAEKTVLRDLASAVAGVGGTRDLFNRSGIMANSLYSLIGWGNAGEGDGQETSKIKDPVPGDGRLRGVFTPDNASLFRPTTSSAFGDPPETLADLIVQPAGKWPLDGNEEAQKAIAYIGSKNNQLGSDPRAAYWIQSFNEATWDGLATTVEHMAYPGDGHGFKEPAFKDAQTELAKEMRFVGRVRRYMSDLAQPFDAESAISSWAKLTTVTDAVMEKIKPPEQKGTVAALRIIGGLATIGGLAASKVLEGIAVIYEVGLEFLVKEPGGDGEGSITGPAHELAADMIARLGEAQDSFRRLGNIIVGDYHKLETVGSLAECSPTAPDCPPEWQLTQQDRKAASTAAYKSVEAEFDQALMKLAFPAYVLGPRVVHHAPKDGHVTTNARDYPCGGTKALIPWYPFDDEQDNGQVALLQELPNLYDVLAMGNVTGIDITHLKPALPPQSVLTRMFAPLSTSLDPNAGGLGIYKPDFIRADNQGRGDYRQAQGFVCGQGDWAK
jgi:hypothetical protein